MKTRDLLNNAHQANFLIGNYMVWKHEQGWSATNIKTGEYFLDIFDWDDRKVHVTDGTGRNYWRDVEEMLQHLIADMGRKDEYEIQMHTKP